jgi:hypothetical protein
LLAGRKRHCHRGINTDDEPVPSFVHNVAPNLLLPPGEDSKNVARCHSEVTMRLETPVLYFYPDKDFNSVFDVRVSMSNGWLTQFFPNASATAPGLEQDGTGTLRFAMSELRWKNISLSFSIKRFRLAGYTAPGWPRRSH